MSSNSDIGEKPVYGDNLSRQLTVQLSSDQYERLFFQPNAAKGDLAKRLGNPTLLGLLGFLVPFSVILFSLLDFQGSSAASLTAVSGTFYAFGGLALILAGVGEFILGNTFPMVVFVIFGCHYVYLGYTNDPLHGIESFYGANGAGALSQSFNAGQGHYQVVFALVSFVFLCGSMRTNVPFVIIFFCLVFLFSFSAAAYYSLGFNPTAAGASHAFYYFKIAGGFGFVAMIMGW
jgi:succinate-acetate transporter protein